MHGREGEDWKRRRRHMWPVRQQAAAPVVVRSSPSSPSDSLVQTSVDSFLKDGRRIRVGDCALFQAGNAPPFVGIIRLFAIGKEDCLNLCVNWLYRPADVKLVKGVLEAAPNEIFYSFHEDVIPAASLLHPCKVAFLRKGLELPSGISSFVCRRVYDIENKCLWWLTDQDYINERQEEVDQLLDKTRIEMHAALQSGGRSPKPLNSPTPSQQLKSGSDSVQNTGASFPSQAKGKKRERGGDQGTEPIKRERPTKPEDGESASTRLDHMIKAEIAKITEKGALTTIEGVEKLIHLLQLDRNDKKIDLAGRILLADVIAATDRVECLGRFVQLRGVPVLDDWLQEAHKGKTGDGSSPKESDKGTEDLLLSLLRALDKLPVNLNALQTCNVGKSVNHLRGHKNSEIQKKARSLVDTWKKRVDAEMTKINDAKSVGSNQAVTWPVKSGFAEVSHSGNKRSGLAEATTKAPTSTCKSPAAKPGQADTIVKSTPVIPGSLKLSSSHPGSISINSKDSSAKGAGSNGNSELPLETVKEEKSSGSSQSQNNSQSCSSDHAKTSTAGSNKTSRHRRSNNGCAGNSVSGVLREGKIGLLNRNGPVDKSHNQSDMPVDHGNSHRLIVRIPNPGRSPARSASGGSLEDPLVPGSRASSPGALDKYDQHERKIKLRADAYRSHISTDVNGESLTRQSNDIKEGLPGSDEGDRSPLDEENRSANETGKAADDYRALCSPSGNGKGVPATERKSRNSFSSMNALIESCAKDSEASAPLSAGDDTGINLLANVAAGEICRSELVSSSASPGGSPKEEPCAANEAKSRLSCEGGGAQIQGQSDENANSDSVKPWKSFGPLVACQKSVETSMQQSSDSKTISLKTESKSTEKERLEGDGSNESTVDDKMPVDHTGERIVEGSAEASVIPSTGIKLEKLGADDAPMCSPAVDEVAGGATLADHPQSAHTDNHTMTVDKVGNDAISSTGVDEVPCSENVDAKRTRKCKELEDGSLNSAYNAKKEQIVVAPTTDVEGGTASASLSLDARVSEIKERKEALDCQPEHSGHESASVARIQAPDKGVKSDKSDRCAESDTRAKLDFDLNEGFSGDDGNQNEQPTSVTQTGEQAIRLPNLSQFSSNSLSNGVHAPITVAAPAKGPFVPPENLLRNKGEPGWKGSAATSAFRPAEPRKLLDMPLNTGDVHYSDNATGKPVRPPLDIDLNVPDERVLEDMASQSSPQTTGSESGIISNRDASARSTGGLDLDLNKVDEGVDNGHVSASASSKLEVPHISGSEANMLRGFDLNNGPGIDEVGSESHHRGQHVKNSNVPFMPTMSGLRMGNGDFGTVSSWFPPGNYPAVAIPSFLPDRGEHAYPMVAAQGAQRILSSVTGAGSFGGDVYRGPVLSSSPAMALPQGTAFPYAFPFGSNFPLTSTSFTGGSTAYVDSTTGAHSCFPVVPSQLVGPMGTVPSHYARPYLVSLPEGSSSVGSEIGRKWSRQGLDLNAGPGSSDVDVKDDRLSSASRQLPTGTPESLMEEQARMYQASSGGMKRKEREGGGSWDERFYKQPSWQ